MIAKEAEKDCVPCEERREFEREALMRIRRGLLGALAGVEQLLTVAEKEDGKHRPHRKPIVHDRIL